MADSRFIVTAGMRSSEGLDERRKRLLYRAWHRGLREMDLVMGHFANRYIDRLDDAELEAFELLVEVPDNDIFDWIVGRAETPPEHDTDIFRRLKRFHGIPGEKWPSGQG